MSKTVLISGAAGFIGTHLTQLLVANGYEIKILTRSAKSSKENVINWDPDKGELDAEALEGLYAVVHLAGENIAGRWTEGKKSKIENSRVDGTTLLSETLANLQNKPKVLVAASAIGYYGSRGDELLTEDSSSGNGFLADVGVKWEQATKSAELAGIRVCNLRIGLVLGIDGGALEKILTPFKLGLGGKIGDGRQYWSWIAIQDLVEIIYFLIKNEQVLGPVNGVAPIAVTNDEFTSALGRALNRPTILPLPAFAVRGLFGEMGEETMLSSTRVVPQKLLDSGYKFKYTTLQDALSDILKTNQ
ncbi:MAG: TIGR01777 family oxidoreductase [Thermodesulfobacteriota bacterium]